MIKANKHFNDLQQARSFIRKFRRFNVPKSQVSSKHVKIPNFTKYYFDVIDEEIYRYNLVCKEIKPPYGIGKSTYWVIWEGTKLDPIKEDGWTKTGINKLWLNDDKHKRKGYEVRYRLRIKGKPRIRTLGSIVNLINGASYKMKTYRIYNTVYTEQEKIGIRSMRYDAKMSTHQIWESMGKRGSEETIRRVCKEDSRYKKRKYNKKENGGEDSTK